MCESLTANPLRALAEAGQAVWLDFLHRRILEDGELTRLIEADAVTGLTSNPSIFQKAIGEGEAYDAALGALVAEADAEVVDLYEQLAIADIRAAADLLAPLWRSLGGRDGFVSLEVSPYLAHDTAGTLAEARRLWRAVDRPNLMIKVPGTAAGVPAIRALIGEGINVNVTLLFSLEAYLAVAEAHMAGLEALKRAGGDVAQTHGVASFFISRIDSLVDAAIDRRLVTAGPPEAAALRAIRGRVAIANAKVAYQRFTAMLSTPRWAALAAEGAAPQRLLWASTGTKDPAYSDVLYVESLIGTDTVNTMPPATLAAFRDHGRAAPTLDQDIEAAERVLAEAHRLGIDLAAAANALEADGVDKFARAHDDLLGAVAHKRERILGARLDSQAITPAALAPAFEATLLQAATKGWTRRLWGRDASLWTGADEAGWLGWLDAATGAATDLAALENLAEGVRTGGFRHALLLGMGGSSLGPEVLARTFGSAPGFPELLVLDSTDPAQIARIAARIDPARTLFIVASKSGSTLEPDILHRYFFDLAERTLGAGRAGARFIAITDPGSRLETTARGQGFWRILPGRPDIGGRYSVLSNFGMTAAAVLGLDIAAAFEASARMARSCGASVPPGANPGFQLGVLMGEAAKAGRDKLTLIADEGIAQFGAWLEQLLAESTGKQGKGVIPVEGEALRPVEDYGPDRLFVRLKLKGEDDSGRDAHLAALAAAGHPTAVVALTEREGIFQEFLRWEVATAIAGAVIGVNPFDQPDVEASKVRTRTLTDAFEAAGGATAETPVMASQGLRLFTDPVNAQALAKIAEAATAEAWVAAHLGRARAGDYLALLAYVDRSPANIERLQALRGQLGRRGPAPVLVQFGPRFLHSTGQAYKGGPASGVFLQITATPARDVAIPGRGLSFAGVEAAQARGDFEVLAERGRRVLRVDLGSDIAAGLAVIEAAAARMRVGA